MMKSALWACYNDQNNSLLGSTVHRVFLLSSILATAPLWAAPINPANPVPLINTWEGIGNNCRTNGTGLCVADGGDDLLDGGAHLRVNGQNYLASNPSDRTGNFYDGGVTNMGGLDVSMQYAFLDPTLMRAIVIFHNPSSSLLATSFEFESNSGADGAMQIVSSSDGNTSFTTADMWLVVDDALLSGGDTAGVYVMFGPGAANTPSGAFTTTSITAGGANGVRSEFNVSVNPGQTSRFLFFIGWNTTATGATTLAQQFNSLPDSSRLVGLSQAELNTIQNFNLAAAGSSDVPEPGTWALLTGGLAALAVYRRRRSS
jgi:hypothetical protein